MAATDLRRGGAALIRACRRLDARGILAGAEGNLSARLTGGRVLITPAGAAKGSLSVRDLVVLHARSAATRRRGASSEAALHLALYAARPDIGAVVHAHAPAATGFAVARKPLPPRALAELAGVVGPVPLVAYRPPGSTALARAVATASRDANAMLLANHGVVALGPTVALATQLLESVEQAARIVLAATILGRVTELGVSAVHALDRARRRAGAGAGRTLPPGEW